MSQKPLYMETTEIAPEKTAAEITSLLVRSGARQISMDYGEGGRLTGLRFALPIEQIPITFVLPVRVEPIFKHLNGRRHSSRLANQKRDREQAERVAWRQLLRWVQAQFAMIDTGMVAADEVFLPYLLHAGTGQMLFEYFRGEGMKQLAAAAPSTAQERKAQ